MVRSILIGLDGSAYSASALELGVRWARELGTLLVGLGVIDEPTIRRPKLVPLGATHFKEQSDQARLDHARQHVETFLEQFAVRCQEAGVAYQLLEDVGVPHEQIMREAQSYDLIMLGQQTHFQFATQEDACATLQTILKSTPRPVVTVPEQLRAGTSLVLAYDGSLQAARVLQAFQTSGLARLGPVHVVCAGSENALVDCQVNRALAFLRCHDIHATPHVVPPTPSVAEALLTQAERLQAGLLILGSYGQTTLREFFLGSVTRSILKHSTCPLFLYH
jgi:nucleotide-binding universal stress UspA family protein